MLYSLKIFLGIWAWLILGGCQFGAAPGAASSSSDTAPCGTAQAYHNATPTEKKLNYGVLAYEEANYQAATIALQGVLDISSSGKPELVKAYKYLAFIQCVSGKEASCREYFKKALEIDPKFNLETAEVGHPIWGPVFRSVKGKSQK